MEQTNRLNRIKIDLTKLCVNIGSRHVGSLGNRTAGKFVAGRLAEAEFSVATPDFDCIDWEYGDIILKIDGKPVEAFISPYSPSCKLNSSFETVANVTELAAKDFTGKIAVFHGELCKEQIAPRNYVFYNPDKHKKIIKLLDEKKPLAIIAITSHNPETAGGQYPFPLFEDGDFNIPSAYLTEEEGAKILSGKGASLYIKMVSERIPAKGCNIIGSKQGSDSRKIVFCAHIDTKKNTPGALDNGTGIAALLTLADLLKGYKGKYGIELLAVNGEDYYAAPGQMKYIADHRNDFSQMILAVNIDGAGYTNGKTGYCCFDCKEPLSTAVTAAFGDNQKFVTTEPWCQSDHSWFMMHGVPAVAITSEQMMVSVMTEITHTPNDNLEKVDIGKVFDVACAMRNLIDLLNSQA